MDKSAQLEEDSILHNATTGTKLYRVTTDLGKLDEAVGRSGRIK